MPAVKAKVKLEHKSGPVEIEVTAATPEVAAYLANRIREVFSGKAPGVGQPDPFTDLRRMFGL